MTKTSKRTKKAAPRKSLDTSLIIKTPGYISVVALGVLLRINDQSLSAWTRENIPETKRRYADKDGNVHKDYVPRRVNCLKYPEAMELVSSFREVHRKDGKTQINSHRELEYDKKRIRLAEAGLQALESASPEHNGDLTANIELALESRDIVVQQQTIELEATTAAPEPVTEEVVTSADVPPPSNKGFHVIPDKDVGQALLDFERAGFPIDVNAVLREHITKRRKDLQRLVGQLGF